MEGMCSKRFTLVETEEFRIDLEYSKDFLILHLPWMARLTKGMAVEMKVKLEDFYEFAKTMGHDYIWAGVEKNNKNIERLLTFFGFEKAGESNGLNVYCYRGEN